MLLRKLFIINLICVTFFMAQGQKSCYDYENKCDGYGPPFKYSGQSKSTVFKKGQTSSFYLVTYGGYEYSVSICQDRNLKGIFFKIREDNPQKTILYDSSVEEDDMLWKQFYVKKSKRLIIEVTVPESEDENERYKKSVGCVAVVVEYLHSSDKGFD